LWKAAREVIVRATHRGCALHWGQAVWCKIAGVGLQSAYSSDEGTYRFCQQLLALPYLLAQCIGSEFERIRRDATTTKLQQLTDYVDNNWVSSSMWPPAAWTVYGRPIRTNNDVEGWHYSLNRKASQSGLNKYLLFALLANEAAMVAVSVKPLSDKKVRRTQKKGTASTEGRLKQYWAEYQTGTRSVPHLLKACARMYAPAQ